MDDKRLVRTSKFLSKHLRHEPEALGLTLMPGGWVRVDDLLRACAPRMPITREELDEVVARNDKRRFSFDPTGTLIRANQGHSTAVDLQLEAVEPPPVLYHGTSESVLPTIMLEGLKKMSRHQVHLSANRETARKVGRGTASRWSSGLLRGPCTPKATRSTARTTACGSWTACLCAFLRLSAILSRAICVVKLYY